MNKKKIKFNMTLDAILKGEIFSVSNFEIKDRELLSLAYQIKVDYSQESKIKSELRRRLITLKKKSNEPVQLTSEELDWAAGGHKEYDDEKKPWE